MWDQMPLRNEHPLLMVTPTEILHFHQVNAGICRQSSIPTNVYNDNLRNADFK